MKTLILSTSDIAGGAARAAYRLHQGLQGIGVQSFMLVQEKSSDDPMVVAPKPNFRRDFAKVRPALESVPLRLYPQRQRTTFSCQFVPDFTQNIVHKIAPDIINIRWVGNGFLPIHAIAKYQMPLVWTLDDMWPFTGGCHYSQDCARYTESCGCCPQLGSDRTNDLSRWIWYRKSRAWKNLNLTVIAPSTWLANQASVSSLFKDLRIEIIPHGLDQDIYRPIDQKIARTLLKLPLDQKIILFGAINPIGDPRKGFSYLQTAIAQLNQASWKDKIQLCIFGASQPYSENQFNINCHYLGRANDDLSLAIFYSAADVMVVPSTQEAFGQTALESLACGTPVVGFADTGLANIIDHQQNGYLAQLSNAEDLARGIIWVLEDRERLNKLSDSARKKVECEFTLKQQAQRYEALFSELLESRVSS